MVDPPFTRQKDRERGRGGGGTEREEEGEKLESFFGTIYDFFNTVPA